MKSNIKVYALIALALSLLFFGIPWADESDLVWSTFLGGSSDEESWGDVAGDGDHSVYVIHSTWSLDFPATAGVFDETSSSLDACVAKLNSTGSHLVYATYLGGRNDEYGYGIAVDGAGSAYVTGLTNSYDFPITPDAFDTSLNDTIPPPSEDAFITKFNSSGDSLIYSTYLGATDIGDIGLCISVDDLGNAYVTGGSYGVDFPVTSGAFDTTHNGASDIYVVKFNATGTALVYATFLGGYASDLGYAITVDGSGNAYVTGSTKSPNLPTTTSAFDATHNGNEDALVAKFTSAGNSLEYATFLGGGEVDWGWDIAVDDSGYAHVTGQTMSADFPTTVGAFSTTYNGGESDAFVTKFNPMGDSLKFSTFLGGNDEEGGWGIALDNAGYVYVTGETESADFPTTPGAFDVTYNGVSDAFIGEFNSTGSDLVYATFLGGSDFDYGVDVVLLDNSSEVYVTGGTYSADFPTSVGAFDTTFNGGEDAFVAKFDLSGYPVPVVLASFEAIGGQGCIALNWTTASEINCHRWEIYRGEQEAGEYVKAGELPGHGSTEATHAYRWIDRHIHPEVTYYYKLKQVDLDGSSWWFDIVSATASSSVPKIYVLHQNHPNPFNASTEIGYQIPKDGRVSLKIFNSLGQEVRALVDADQKASSYAVIWDGRDNYGREVASGLYFCRMIAAGYGKTVKMALLK